MPRHHRPLVHRRLGLYHLVHRPGRGAWSTGLSSAAAARSGGTASIPLRWLSDEAVNARIRLRWVRAPGDPVCAAGTAVPGSGNPGQTSSSLSSPVIIDSGFTSGLMALDSVVCNAALDEGLNPTGLRVQILSATGSDIEHTSTPEPSPLVLSGIASLVLEARRLRARAMTDCPACRVPASGGLTRPPRP